MKTILLALVFAVTTVVATAQEKCTFFIDKGTKEVKELKCGNFNDLKVKVPIPQNAADFDKVTIMFNSTGSKPRADVDFEGAGALKMLAGKTKELWISNPDKPDGNGDFLFSLNLEGEKYTSMRTLCTSPKNLKMTNITILLQAVGFTKTGSKQYYSEKDKVWKTKMEYDKGTVLATGTIDVALGALDNAYTDKTLKIVYPDPSISNVKSTDDLSTDGGWDPFVYKVIKYTSTKLELVEKGAMPHQQNTSVTFNIIKAADIENLETYKKAKSANASYTPLQFIKDATENWFMYKSCGCSTMDDIKKGKYKPEISMGSFFTNGLVEDLKKDKNVSNELLKKKETKDLWTPWSTKTMGKNTFEYAYIEKVFFANCNTGKLAYDPSYFEPAEIFLYYKNPNIFIITPTVINASKRAQYYDEAKQKAYIKSVLENVEFP